MWLQAKLTGSTEQRGPKYAKVYAQEADRPASAQEAAQNTATDESIPTPPAKTASEGTASSTKAVEKEVIVLRGGFTRWQEKYKDDPKLVENWRASIWGSGYSY